MSDPVLLLLIYYILYSGGQNLLSLNEYVAVIVFGDYLSIGLAEG